MTQNEYYVVFMPSEHGLFKLFEKKGFNHCIVFMPIDAETVEEATMLSIVSHNKSFVSFGLIDKKVFMRYIRKGFYIKVNTAYIENRSLWWWMPTPDTCVTITKQILGIRKPFIWSPYQLYRYIKRSNLWAEVQA